MGRQYPHAILPVSVALCEDKATSSTDIAAYFLHGVCGSQHPPCLRALPHRGLLAGGTDLRTDELCEAQ